MLTLCGSDIQQKLASFEVNIAAKLPKVYCDAEIVELILINSLKNAAEAVAKQASWVKLDVTQPAKRDPYLVAAVRDNGCGIVAEEREKIFQPFFSTKAASGGTGMGLYMGAIPVDST